MLAVADFGNLRRIGLRQINSFFDQIAFLDKRRVFHFAVEQRDADIERGFEASKKNFFFCNCHFRVPCFRVSVFPARVSPCRTYYKALQAGILSFWGGVIYILQHFEIAGKNGG